MRQDRQGVRTAQDLERKYKLAEMVKAFELPENTLTRVNQILQDFVNTVVGTLDNFDGLSDGHITTYFSKGFPSIDAEWAEEKEVHVNDLYYDKDTGKGYTFTSSEGVFSWVEIEDENKIKVLAMANATVDAKDGKRRIFVEEPTTPYDNGDLWLKDGVIYCCQISKPSTEVFENHDFIESSKYSGDTLAIKVGTALQVLKGTVLKVIEDTDFMRVEINDLDEETTSFIELTEKALSSLITDADGQSMMVQTGDSWTFDMTSIIERINANTSKTEQLEDGVNEAIGTSEGTKSAVRELEKKTARVNIGSINGQPTIELSAEGSDFKVVITNTEILFMEGTYSPASITNKKLVIKDAQIDRQLQIGTLAWVKRANGHISLMEVF